MYNPFKASYVETEDKRILTLGYGYLVIAVAAVAYGVFKLATR